MIGIRANPSTLLQPSALSDDLCQTADTRLFVFLWATGFIGARYAMPWAEPFSFLARGSASPSYPAAAARLLLGARRLMAG